MKPYYDRNGVTLYHGDARDILPALESADVIITDPVWPNAPDGMFDIGLNTPEQLLSETLEHAQAERVVIQLGCNSDPRFLDAVPSRWPFLRVCWLRYARPSYIGRLLNGGDVAYAFGSWPPSEPGGRVIPGEMVVTDTHDGKNEHPSPRRIETVKWLCRWFARGLVVDPFAGSGTTLVAARAAGYPAIGIEQEERYCEIAVRRLQQESLDFMTVPA